MTRVPCWITAALLALSALPTHAAGDWIDEFPTVTAVAHAVREQLKVDTANWRFDVRGVALEDDDDLYAVYIAGTLVLLRRIMLYEYQGEEEPLAPEREAKLRSLVAAYLEAELVIGQGVGKRRGYLTTAQKCRDMECYRRWFSIGISNVGGAAYRRRILARLFPCDPARAAEIDRLAQSYAVRAPHLPSPADTLTIEPEMAGVAAAGCATYAGDANRNGLCDAWEQLPRPIALEKVRMAPGGGLRVTLPKGSVPPGGATCFRVWRAENPAIDASAKEIWPLGDSGSAAIVVDAADARLHAIVAQGVDLTAEQPRPYLLVEVTTGGTTAPVHCEQPSLSWRPRQRNPAPSGLHGPYRSADAAVLSTAPLAMALTASNEAAYIILRDARGPGDWFYATPPVVAKPPPNAAAGAIVTNGDYGSSLRTAFDGSCEEPASFEIASWVHTHPTQAGGLIWMNDNFSMLDFNFAVSGRSDPGFSFGADLQLRSAPQRIYRDGDPLVPASGASFIYLAVPNDKCVRGFTSRDGDAKFTDAELDPVNPASTGLVNVLETMDQSLQEAKVFVFSKHYNDFRDRQRVVRCD